MVKTDYTTSWES